MRLNIQRILKNLHCPGYLEIEGVDPVSAEAQFLGYFSPQGEDKKVVYVLRDFYDESGGDSYRDVDFVQFPRATLEELIEKALKSENKMARDMVEGKRITHYEVWHHYSGYHSGGPPQSRKVEVELVVNLVNKPSLSIKIWDKEAKSKRERK